MIKDDVGLLLNAFVKDEELLYHLFRDTEYKEELLRFINENKKEEAANANTKDAPDCTTKDLSAGLSYEQFLGL